MTWEIKTVSFVKQYDFGEYWIRTTISLLKQCNFGKYWIRNRLFHLLINATRGNTELGLFDFMILRLGLCYVSAWGGFHFWIRFLHYCTFSKKLFVMGKTDCGFVNYLYGVLHKFISVIKKDWLPVSWRIYLFVSHNDLLVRSNNLMIDKLVNPIDWLALSAILIGRILNLDCNEGMILKINQLSVSNN